MIIYTVKKGDSLYTISEKFGISSLDIKSVNGLGTHPYLVAGQSLLIPAKIKPRALSEYTDNIIRIPNKKYKPPINVAAFTELDLFGVDSFLDESRNCLTFLSPLRYAINADYSLQPLGSEAILPNFLERNVKILIYLKCDNIPVYNQDLERKLIKNILKLIKAYGYRGVYIDCGINPDALPIFIWFIRRIKNVIRLPVFVEIEPKYWLGTHSFATIGNVADILYLKLFDHFKNFRTPGALAPVDLAEEILSYAVSVVPNQKLMIKLPVYGYDWDVSSSKMSTVSSTNAVTMAARFGAEIKYDSRTRSPHTEFSDEFDNRHVVWFEDINSLYSKIKLIEKYRLAGVGFELIDYDTFSLWNLVRQMYNIKR